MWFKKIALLLICGFLGSSIYAQSKDSLKVKTFNFFKSDFKQNNRTFHLKKIRLTSSDAYFSYYNKTTHLYDNYLIVHNKFSYSNSSPNYYNNFIFYTDNNLLLENYFKHNKRDSFNPNGVSNIGEALFYGVLESIFKKRN